MQPSRYRANFAKQQEVVPWKDGGLGEHSSSHTNYPTKSSNTDTHTHTHTQTHTHKHTHLHTHTHTHASIKESLLANKAGEREREREKEETHFGKFYRCCVLLTADTVTDRIWNSKPEGFTKIQLYIYTFCIMYIYLICKCLTVCVFVCMCACVRLDIADRSDFFVQLLFLVFIKVSLFQYILYTLSVRIDLTLALDKEE